MTQANNYTSKTRIMGVINVTPDSFSDGGKFLALDQAMHQLNKLIEDGAAIIDIGAESTRPGAKALDPNEEWHRLLPFLREIKAQYSSLKIPISLDTYHSETMLKSLDFEVSFINNIFGIADTCTLKTLARHSDLNYIGMHIHGTPSMMQINPLSGCDIIESLNNFQSRMHEVLDEVGFHQDRIFVDPGIGFGKTDSANLMALHWAKLQAPKSQIAIGLSRKGFIGRIFDPSLSPKERDPLSKALETMLLTDNVAIIRTHEVKTLKTVQQMLCGESEYA